MKVLLYLKRNGQYEQGMCPLMGRISIKGHCNSTAQFSCKVKVNPKLWNATSQRCMGKSKVATTTNREIEKMLLLIRYRFDELVEAGKKFCAEDLKNAFQGIASVQMTLLRLYKIHNEEFAQRVGVNRAESSYYQYTVNYRRLEEYIRTQKKVSDLPLKQLDMTFIEDYALYLQKEWKYKPATKIGHIKALSKLMNMAVYRGLIPANPFKGFKTQQPEQKKRYLEMDELKKIMTVELTKPNCILTRDLFVFSAFTGICYCDMCNLKETSLVQMADGTYWINTCRQKTGTPENVRLMDIPLAIVRKYKGMTDDGKLLPMLADGSIRTHLRRIAEKCGFDFYFSFHQARHTFGTTICLGNGIPIETISKIMGHRNINITQHYAKVTEKKIADDVSGLGFCLGSKYALNGATLPPSHILKDMSRRKPRPRRRKEADKTFSTIKQ